MYVLCVKTPVSQLLYFCTMTLLLKFYRNSSTYSAGVAKRTATEAECEMYGSVAAAEVLR